MVFSSTLRWVSNADDQSQKTYVSGTHRKNPPTVPDVFWRFLRRAVDGRVIVRTGRRIPGVRPLAAVYACGPAGMLEGVRAICAEAAAPAQLALEAGMACGFGACFGCVVPRRGGGYLRRWLRSCS